nr:MAG TPA: hypothetical protein [Caudoviricetes sp.]
MRGGGFGVFGFEGGEFLGHHTEFGLEVVDLGFLLIELIHEAEKYGVRRHRGIYRCGIWQSRHVISAKHRAFTR